MCSGSFKLAFLTILQAEQDISLFASKEPVPEDRQKIETVYKTLTDEIHALYSTFKSGTIRKPTVRERQTDILLASLEFTTTFWTMIAKLSTDFKDQNEAYNILAKRNLETHSQLKECLKAKLPTKTSREWEQPKAKRQKIRNC